MINTCRFVSTWGTPKIYMSRPVLSASPAGAATTASTRTAAWRTLKLLDDIRLIDATRVPKSRKIGVKLRSERHW